MDKQRLNIGLFVDDLDSGFTASIVRGALLAVREMDANLYLFPGKYLNPDYEDKKMTKYNYQFNTIFSYAAPNQVDILFVLLGSIASTLNKKEQAEFLDSLGDVPIVTICCEVPGYPSVNFDNSSGFYQAIEHMITHHNAKNIGFVGGPQTNDDAVERQKVYLEVMKDYRLPVSENMIVHGNFSDYCTDVVEQLLDQNEKLDAIVFANDSMAVAGYKVLAERGYEIGKDILVIGFDDEDYAAAMDPPLTTVKSNGVELGYKALINSPAYKETGVFENFKVASSLVLRKSCGCAEATGSELIERLGLEDKHHYSYEQKRRIIIDYLFSGYTTAEDTTEIKVLFKEFIDLLFFAELQGQLVEEQQGLVYKRFVSLFYKEILSYTTSDRLFDVMRLLQHMLEMKIERTYNKSLLSDLFYKFYRAMAEQTLITSRRTRDEIEKVNHRINSFAREMISFDEAVDLSYENVSEILRDMELESSFLYIFKEPKNHFEDKEWVMPDYVYLKAYHTSNGAFAVPEEHQQIPISRLFHNSYTKTDHRVAQILVPLFSNEKQYGLMLCELEQKFHYFLIPTVYQLSAAIRTLYLLEQQRKVESELEGNLRIAMQNNEYLETISKIDELSKIYNRRGFYEQIDAIMKHPDTQGKKAVLVFGDLDGLKTINDKYGHDDGDLAIRTIAEVLSEAFGSEGIVARFGGDEFAALVMMNQVEFEQTMLPSFAHIRTQANERLDLPYEIDMSIGYTEFEIGPEVVLSELLEQADSNLYEEKKKRKTMRVE